MRYVQTCMGWARETILHELSWHRWACYLPQRGFSPWWHQMGLFWTCLLSQMAWLVFLLVLRGQRLCYFKVATEMMLTAIQCVSRMRLQRWLGLQTVGTGHRCLQLDCCLAVMGPWWYRWQKVGFLQLLWWVTILSSPPPSPSSNNLSTQERLKNLEGTFDPLFKTLCRH